MAGVFLVWSGDRTKKVSFLADRTVDAVIKKGNEKMKIKGKQLHLEENGTLIDDGEVLNFFQGKIFMLLENNEIWKKDVVYEENKEKHSVDLAVNELHEQEDTLNESSLTANAEDNVLSVVAPAVVIDIPLDLRENLNLWQNYSYDWSNLDIVYLRQVQSGIRKKTTVNEVVRRVISQMRQINTKIGAPVLKRVAREIVESYPEMFEDKNLGKRYGTGYVSLFDALKERNNYLNRAERKRPPSNTNKVPSKQVKLRNTTKVGTVNWQPEVHPAGETEESIQAKQEWLNEKYITLMNGPIDLETDAEIKSKLTATFKAQRDFFNDFNNLPTIQDLILQWPILLRKEYLFHHYQQLMGHSIEILRLEFNKHKEAMFAYAQVKALTNAETVDDRSVINFIFDYFKESPYHLIRDCPPGPEGSLGAPVPARGPCILCQAEEDEMTYQLAFDTTIVGSTRNFFEGVMWAFATYFVWNRLYPASYAHSLETLQRYILNLHPSGGNSRSPKSGAVLKKVDTFFKKMSKVSIIGNNDDVDESFPEN